MTPTPIIIFEILLLLLVAACAIACIVGLVIGIVQRRSGLIIGFATPLVLIAGLLLLAPAMFWMSSPVHVKDVSGPYVVEEHGAPTRTVDDNTVVARRDADSPSASTAFSDLVDRNPAYLADVYPSTDAAVRALGRHLGHQERFFSPAQPDTPTQVLIVAPQNARPLAPAFVQAMQRHIAHPVTIHHRHGLSDDDPPHDVRINFMFHPDLADRPLADAPTQPQPGTLTAEILRDNLDHHATVSAEDQPWAEQFHTFARQQPGGSWVLGESPAFASSADQALHDALQHAAQRVRIPVVPELAEHELHELGELVEDRLVQRLDTPHGTVYRAKVLLDASPERRLALTQRLQTQRDAQAQRVQTQRHADSREVRTQILQFVGLGVVLMLVYGFLQVATRGYYTLAVRAFVGACVVGGVILLLVIS